MFNAIADAVLDMSFQNHLAAAMQRRFRCVQLGKNILTGNILINHFIDGPHLADDLF